MYTSVAFISIQPHSTSVPVSIFIFTSKPHKTVKYKCMSCLVLLNCNLTAPIFSKFTWRIMYRKRFFEANATFQIYQTMLGLQAQFAIHFFQVFFCFILFSRSFSKIMILKDFRNATLIPLYDIFQKTFECQLPFASINVNDVTESLLLQPTLLF